MCYYNQPSSWASLTQCSLQDNSATTDFRSWSHLMAKYLTLSRLFAKAKNNKKRRKWGRAGNGITLLVLSWYLKGLCFYNMFLKSGFFYSLWLLRELPKGADSWWLLKGEGVMCGGLGLREKPVDKPNRFQVLFNSKSATMIMVSGKERTQPTRGVLKNKRQWVSRGIVRGSKNCL